MAASPDLAPRLPIKLRASLPLLDLLYSLGMRPRDTGFRDVVDKIGPMLGEPADLPPALMRDWLQAYRLLDELSAYRDRLTPMAGTAFDALGGQRTSRPLIACLLQSPAEEHRFQIRALQKLLIVGILLHRKGHISEGILNKAATEIRLAGRPVGDQRTIVSDLPSGTFGMERIVETLAVAQHLAQTLKTNKEEDRPASVIHNIREFLRCIEVLASAVVSAAYILDPSRQPTPVVLEDSDEKTGTVLIDQSIPVGDITGEAEETYLFQSHDAVVGEEPSETRVRIATALSHYWLTQAQIGFVWDRRRINPLEFPRLQRFLASLPHLVDSGRLTSVEALVVALVASLGRDSEAILDLKIGPDAEITQTGKLRRQVRLLADAYKPSPDDRDCFLPGHTTELNFDLPKTVKLLLRLVLRSAAPPVPFTVSALTGKGASMVTRLREMIGNSLRDNVSPRLEYRHLNTVLRHETYSATRDPLFTYLIAGQPHQLPPIGLYYTTANAALLKRIHRAVTCRLFNEADPVRAP